MEFLRVSNEILLVDGSATAMREHIKAIECVGMAVCHIYTMREAIVRLINKEDFRCVVINEDSTPDLWELLSELCDVALIDVFVTTHAFTKEKQSDAMGLGADAYVQYAETPMVDAVCMVQHLKLHEKWAERPLKPVPVLIGGEVIMLTNWHRVLVKSTEVPLARKEYTLLEYLLSNPNRILSFEQIGGAVWGMENVPGNSVYQHMNKVKSKLGNAGFNSDSIINVAGVGYRFSTKINCGL